jgi:[ribosomal protein S5]-alanine N-acetyltransferase
MIFETKRLLVRQYSIDDSEDFYLLNSDPVVMKYIRAPKTRQQSLQFLHENIEYYDQFLSYGRWALLEKNPEKFIGSFMLRPSISIPNKIELGYALLAQYWGKGYATESVKSGLQYAFKQLKIPLVVAITQPGNALSQNVLIKCGFIQQEDVVENGRIINLFSIENNIRLETERIEIIPLNYRQLELYLRGQNLFETEFQLTKTDRKVFSEVEKRVREKILPRIQKALFNEYLFNTFWVVIDKCTKIIVAELGFKGNPNIYGEIEIGYGTIREHRKKGYMSEAVKRMIDWAVHEPEVTHVLAETDENNIASIRILEKNNFQMFDRVGKMKWWRISTK